MKLTLPCALFICMLFFSAGLQGQTANKIWHFGDRCTLHFDPGNTHSGELSYGYSNAGCASVASPWNTILFYTNGVSIRNRNHTVMPNGNGLMAGAGTESTQGVVVMGYPRHDSMFLVFTTDESANNAYNGLRYSVLDLRLDSTRGDIVASQKNLFVYPNTSEHLSVAKGRYQTYYWLVTHLRNSAKFAAFRVDSNGVNTTPVLSAAGSFNDTSSDRMHDGGIGQLKFNKFYTRAAMALYGQRKVEVFSFDNNTGKLVLLQTIPTPEEPYGVEFDPDYNCLYYSLERGVYQVDLTSLLDDLQLSVTPIGYSYKFHPFGDLQIAPDGKIYTAVNNANWLSAFTPFAFGTPSTFKDTSVMLRSPMVLQPQCKRGLPNYFVELPPNGTTPVYDTSFTLPDSCNSDTLTFSFGNISNVTYIEWDFGESTSAFDMDDYAVGYTVRHKYHSSGKFRVTAIIHTEYFDDTIARYVNVVMCDSATGNMVCKTYAANAFTPNQDGTNDKFRPVLTCATEYYRYAVYNRWGERVFYSENAEEKWDGTYKGQPCELGVYYYMVYYKFINGEPGVLSGDVTLVR